MLFSFKVIRKLPPRNVQIQALKSEIVKAVEPVGRQFVAERRRITDKFSFAVDWDHRVNVQETGLQLLIFLKNAHQKVGSVTVATILDWLFVTGVKSHVVRAKKPGGFLRFEWGGPGSYDRITPRSGARPGTGAVSNGEVFFRREVMVKGFEPSPAIERIDQRLGKTLANAFDRGIRLGLKKLSQL